MLHLVLLGVARTDHRLLDRVGGIFGNGQLQHGGRQHEDAARLPELERGAGIGVDEGLLHGGLIRLIFAKDVDELGVELEEALGQRLVAIGMERAIGHIGEARAFLPDDAPAGVAQARVDADDSDHGS